LTAQESAGILIDMQRSRLAWWMSLVGAVSFFSIQGCGDDSSDDDGSGASGGTAGKRGAGGTTSSSGAQGGSAGSGTAGSR
jgi:hypothetical protein